MESEINAVPEEVPVELPAAPESRNYGNVVPEEEGPGQESRGNEVEAPKKSPRAQT